MMYKRFGLCFRCFSLFILFLAACGKKNDPQPQNDTLPDFSSKPGVFILNEGNFQWGNGSVDFYNLSTKKHYSNIFQWINQRPTGDVVQHMIIDKDKGWIVVNNSGKIEVVNIKTFRSLKTLTGYTSPRYLLSIPGTKFYLSDLYKPVIYVLDKEGNKVKEIRLPRTTEQMLFHDGNVWALHWSSYGGYDNTGISRIDASADTLIYYIPLSKEPNSGVIDRDGNIWILCSGGFMKEELPRLWKLDADGNIIGNYVFSSSDDYPTRLNINPSGDTLYYLNKNVYALAVDNPALPGEKLIEAGGRNFYGLSVGSCILISDALNYQQKGMIYSYTRGGKLLDSFYSGIIPGNFTWND